MTLPQILADLMKLLFDMAVPAAICTMVLAGIALRQEGGVNFQAGGKFQRWALWSVILLTLPQFLSWFAAQGISMPGQGGGPIRAIYHNQSYPEPRKCRELLRLRCGEPRTLGFAIALTKLRQLSQSNSDILSSPKLSKRNHLFIASVTS